MPRSKKPHNLKVISGTVRASQKPIDAVELPLVTGHPKPPSWLKDKNAKLEWGRLAPVLVANGLLTEGGMSSLGHLCAIHGIIIGLWQSGENPTGFLLSQYRALVNDFRLTPRSQGLITPITPVEENPFSTIGKREH